MPTPITADSERVTSGAHQRTMNKVYAQGRLKRGQMNDTEKLYSQLLDEELRAGEILWYKFEGITLVIAEGVRYTPDFVLMNKNNEIEIREVKGMWLGDAKIKFRMAADVFPFKFTAIQKTSKKRGTWETLMVL